MDEYHERMKKEFLADMESAEILRTEAKHVISIETALQYVMHYDRLRALYDIGNTCRQ